MGLARQVEEGEVELQVEPVDLAELIRRSVGDLERVILRDHPVELELPEAFEVDADPTAIREIVFELLSNAAKYSEGGAPVKLSLHRGGDEADGPLLSLTVAETAGPDALGSTSAPPRMQPSRTG